MLYSELYFRHIYAKLQPTTEERIQSWDNYNKLFETFLGKKKKTKESEN